MGQMPYMKAGTTRTSHKTEPYATPPQGITRTSRNILQSIYYSLQHAKMIVEIPIIDASNIEPAMTLRNTDLNLVTIFDALWTTRSVSRAAKMLNMSQSSVSAALSRLRRQFGDLLFVWDGQRMIPTVKAQHLGPALAEIVERLSATLNDGASLKHFKREFVVGAIDYIAAVSGPKLLKKIQTNAEGLTVDLVDARTYMRKGTSIAEVDLFILPQELFPRGGMAASIIYKDRYVCIGKAGGLSTAKRLNRRRFLELPQVAFSAELRLLYSHETRLYGANQVEPNIVALTSSYLVLPYLVAETDCLAVIPSRLASLAAKQFDIKIMPIPVPTPELVLTMYWDRRLSNDSAHRWLRNTISEVLQSAA